MIIFGIEALEKCKVSEAKVESKRNLKIKII